MNKFNFKKNNLGFTLVEMMVAIAVFSLVMVVAMSALINVIDANLKAQAIKTAINNVHFALESISKDMRVGTNYGCGSIECASSSETLSYKSHDGKNIIYTFTPPSGSTPGKIQRKVDNGAPQDITSQEVNILKMKFFVVNESDIQPRVLITLSGEAGSKEKIRTTFDLQTGVSQRLR